VLYKRSDFLGQKKSLSLTYDTDFNVDIYEENEDGSRLKAATFVVKGVDDVA